MNNFENVFILSTGRCGSLTFAKACNHFTNYTSEHESLSGELGKKRFEYPLNHIESDNRLSWFLGKLNRYYGNNAFYVHLKRDKVMTAQSFEKRSDRGIMSAYQKPGILIGSNEADMFKVALDYVETVNSNIEYFLSDKDNKMDFYIENPEKYFEKFINNIGAKGKLDKAFNEFKIKHNKS